VSGDDVGRCRVCGGEVDPEYLLCEWCRGDQVMNNPGMANTSASPILRFFEFEHLPIELQDISQACSNLASYLETRLPAGAEKSTALRKLLECSDSALRAALP